MWMTQHALHDLESERTALEGAPGELSQQDQARLIEVRRLIAEADVTPKPDDGLVEPGMRIVIQYADEELDAFVLSDHAIEGERAVSLESPIGRAINGRQVGDEVTYSTPSGASQKVTILTASPHSES